MKKLCMLLIALIVASGVALPLIVAATAQSDPRPPVMRIADVPTPTPTPHGGGRPGGCDIPPC